MLLSLRPARIQDLEFCEALDRSNMGRYLAARGIAWEPERFLASWATFENLMILSGRDTVGLVRLLPEPDALGLRDLQVVAGHRGRGIGAWTVRQVRSIAADRGFSRVRLRVYEENPARALYARLGFRVESAVHGTLHMVCDLPAGDRSAGPAVEPRPRNRTRPEGSP